MDDKIKKGYCAELEDLDVNDEVDKLWREKVAVLIKEQKDKKNDAIINNNKSKNS